MKHEKQFFGLVAVLVFISILAALFYLTGTWIPKIDSRGSYQSNMGEIIDDFKSSEVIKVNGEEITADDVDEAYVKIPKEGRGDITREAVMESLINEKLLLMEAKRQNIKVNAGDEAQTKQMIIARLIEQNVDLGSVKISEEEVNEMFEEEFGSDILEDDSGLAALLRDHTEMRLEAKAHVGLVQSYLNELMENAKIE